MGIENSNLALATVAVAVVIGALLMKPKPSPREETWESHVPDRHGSLQQIHSNLYSVEASGCEYGPPTRNMTIYRCPENGKLVIISAVAVKEETLKDILKLGVPSVLVVPNTMHRCCAPVWKKRFPEMTVICPDFDQPGNGRATIEEVVKVDMTTDELCALPEWKDWLSPRRIDGWAHFEEVLEVKLAGDNKKAMIVCDLLFTMPRGENTSGFAKLIEWVFDSSIDIPPSGQMIVPKISRIARIFGIQDWKKAERWYRTYAQECGSDILAIMVGHGPPSVEVKSGEGCKAALEGVADQLAKPRW